MPKSNYKLTPQGENENPLIAELIGAQGLFGSPADTLIDWARSYWEWGLNPLPKAPGEKRPLIPWKKLTGDLPWKTFRDLSWAKGDGIVAVITSWALVIDIDTPQARELFWGLIERLERGGYARGGVRTGRGYHVYLKVKKHGIKIIQGRKGDAKFEVRGHKHVVVMPPSPHPNGGVYEWVIPLTPGRPLPAVRTLWEWLGELGAELQLKAPEKALKSTERSISSPRGIQIPAKDRKGPLRGNKGQKRGTFNEGQARKTGNEKRIKRGWSWVMSTMESLLEKAKVGNRNELGYWLCLRLIENRLPRETIERVLDIWVERVNEKTRGEPNYHPYTDIEARKSLTSAYKRAWKGKSKEH